MKPLILAAAFCLTASVAHAQQGYGSFNVYSPRGIYSGQYTPYGGVIYGPQGVTMWDHTPGYQPQHPPQPGYQYRQPVYPVDRNFQPIGRQHPSPHMQRYWGMGWNAWGW